MMHTARWNHSVALDNKNVVVIGNGCSGTQVVPAIADKVKNIYQFFRTSQYYFPRRNPNIKPWLKWAFLYIPGMMTLARWLMFNLMERNFVSFYTDGRGNRRREAMKKRSDDYVEQTAPKQYWDLLKPSYMVGCKRRVFDPGYLKCLKRDNVHISNDQIVKIGPKEVITASGKCYPADVIVRHYIWHGRISSHTLTQVLANGFVTGKVRYNIVGRDGITAVEHWKQHGGIEAYKTTALSSFPNFFMLLGPNAASGLVFLHFLNCAPLTLRRHTSVLFSMEVTVDLVIKLVRPIIKGKASAVAVKDDYERKYSVELQGALKQRVWAGCQYVTLPLGTRSWY